MSNVQAISGATGDEFNSLRDKAIDMGAETVFSASESAEAMSNIAQMGWETNQILGGIEHTLSLAAAGGLELADSAMIMANSMNQFGLEASEAERVADVMAYAASSAGTDVTGLGDALQYVSNNARTLRKRIEYTAVLIGVQGDAGITGSKAGTTLNAMLRDLKSSAEDGAIAVGDQSVALYDAEGNMRNMPGVIRAINRARVNMSEEQRDAAFAAIMGDQALVGFNAIASKGADSVSKLADELYDSEGAAAEMSDVMQDNLGGALTELSSAFEGVQIALGTALTPVIQKVAESLKGLADWFNNLDDSTKNTIGIMLGIAAALALVVGPILLLIGFIPSIISGFTAIVTVVKTVSKAFMLLTNPIGLIVVAVVGLAYLIYRYWDEIKEFTIETWNAIAEFFVGLWESITETAIEAWNAIAEFFAELWESIVEIAVMAWEGLIEVFAALMHPFIEIFENMKDGLVAIWEGVLSFFEGIWELIKNVFLGAVLLILNLVTGNFEELKSNAIAIWNNIKDALGAIWEGIKGIVSGAVQAVWGFVTTAWNNIKQSTSTVFNAVRTIITTIWDGIKSFFTETLSNIWTTVTDKFSDIVSATSEKMGEVKDKIVEIWDGIIDFFKGIDLMQIGKDIIQGLINGIGSMATAAWDKAKEIGNGIVNGIKGVLNIGSPSKVMAEIGVWTGEGLAIGRSEERRGRGECAGEGRW